ncbi:Transposable element P transposase [Frankliniella fusca]|uniref:Transposable element P transposase n=1 Tax=Frankliniella fusca TaxID=407009 RepID=A0AAE1LG76_9NEOP|nr:Transposable element P transposase [Frankliniella fusca]
MHTSLDKHSNEIYCTQNLYSGDSRPLYFIIDPPHLVKTVRNCIANSFSHRKTRKLWKINEFLSWQVLERLYDITKGNKFMEAKLTKAHVKLTSFSCMTVLLATQVLSASVANSIEANSSHESLEKLDTSELVKLIRLMNRFFDCMNGKEDFQEETAEGNGYELRNPDLAAYKSVDDPRFEFLENTFLNYFEDWKQDVLKRPGIYTESERSRMIISHQSLESLTITVKGFVGATKYMLGVVQAPKINARSFNQDPLEQYFGKMRRMLGDNRQPRVQSFLHARLNERAQSSASIETCKGNTTVERRKGLKVDSTPLPSRKKPKTAKTSSD